MKHLLSAILLLVLPVQSKDITVHVLPHSHWDREWYMPFEQHRLRLVDLLDAVLQQCETDDDFYFLCDGQTIMVEDYLAVRPENRERIGRAIRERRLSYGPQYILPDTYLADAESQVRNYLIAVREAEQWAPAASAEELALPPFFLSVGYFPDTFGNTAQTPQYTANTATISRIGIYILFRRPRLYTGKNRLPFLLAVARWLPGFYPPVPRLVLQRQRSHRRCAGFPFPF